MSFKLKIVALKNNIGGKMKRYVGYRLGGLIVFALMAFAGNTYAMMSSGGGAGTTGGTVGTGTTGVTGGGHVRPQG